MALGPDRAVAATTRMKGLLISLLVALGAAACDRPKANVPGQPNSQPERSLTTRAPLAVWDDSVGTTVATPSADNETPLVFSRDTTGTADIDVDLFNHEARTVRAVLHPTATVRSCAWERSAGLSLVEPGPAPVWSLALSPGIAKPLEIDGVGELLPRDSAQLVVRISRMVSAMPEDSTSTPFRGLPIVVRDAWRFRAAGDSAVVVIAVATRTLNVESNPRVEAVTVIAESGTPAGTTELRLVFSRRDAGPEDRVEGTDLLAAFQLRNAHSAVALLREGEAGRQVEIVERISAAVWRTRWSSASYSCRP